MIDLLPQGLSEQQRQGAALVLRALRIEADTIAHPARCKARTMRLTVTQQRELMARTLRTAADTIDRDLSRLGACDFTSGPFVEY